jgi:hypothetical protein
MFQANPFAKSDLFQANPFSNHDLGGLSHEQPIIQPQPDPSENKLKSDLDAGLKKN